MRCCIPRISTQCAFNGNSMKHLNTAAIYGSGEKTPVPSGFAQIPALGLNPDELALDGHVNLAIGRIRPLQAAE